MARLCSTCGSPLKQDIKFCTSCGQPVTPPITPSSSPPETIERVVKNPMSSKAKLVYALIGLSLFGIFLFLFINHLPGGEHPIISKQPEVAMATMYTGQTIEPTPISAVVENGKVVFPLTLLLEKKAVSFEYRMPTGSLPLLAFISSEGKLVTAIRMCEPCNSKKFTIEGTELACGNCETRWKLSNLEGIQGSCQKYPPDPVPSTVVNNQVQIDESVLQHWKIRI